MDIGQHTRFWHLCIGKQQRLQQASTVSPEPLLPANIMEVEESSHQNLDLTPLDTCPCLLKELTSSMLDLPVNISARLTASPQDDSTYCICTNSCLNMHVSPQDDSTYCICTNSCLNMNVSPKDDSTYCICNNSCLNMHVSPQDDSTYCICTNSCLNMHVSPQDDSIYCICTNSCLNMHVVGSAVAQW